MIPKTLFGVGSNVVILNGSMELIHRLIQGFNKDMADTAITVIASPSGFGQP
jgi:hypothetical protein